MADSGRMLAGQPGAAGSFDRMLRGAGVARLDETGWGGGWIRVTGEDRVRWLNGMVTNSIQGLGPGEGCYNFLLSAQGRIQGTAWAFAEAEALLLETDRGQVEGMLALLDRFVIMDDVELRDVSAEWFGVGVFGLEAGRLLGEMGLGAEMSLEGTGARMADGVWDGVAVRVVTLPGKVVPRYEVWVGTAEERDRICERLAAAGAVVAGEREMEWMRMLEGRARFGVDIRERELPQETGQAGQDGPGGALHFSKGCYLGQEIVERIRSRGAVHRTFRGFAVEGPMPVAAAALLLGGKSVGEVTSVAEVPAFPGYPEGLRMVLASVRREAVEGAGVELAVAGGGTARLLPLPVQLASEAHPNG